jgi:hypothetical protein
MQRIMEQICGLALASLCLVSTLALAQPQNPTQSPTSSGSQTPMQSQDMTCMKDDGKGQCTVAVGTDGKEVVVVGSGLAKGARMTCVDMGGVVNCKKAATP